MKLSKECIEAIITNCNTVTDSKCRDFSKAAMVDALTNPSIFSKAGLISLEDALGFGQFVCNSEYYFRQGFWWSIAQDKDAITPAQLFQIYQEQKEK